MFNKTLVVISSKLWNTILCSSGFFYFIQLLNKNINKIAVCTELFAAFYHDIYTRIIQEAISKSNVFFRNLIHNLFERLRNWCCKIAWVLEAVQRLAVPSVGLFIESVVVMDSVFRHKYMSSSWIWRATCGFRESYWVPHAIGLFSNEQETWMLLLRQKMQKGFMSVVTLQSQ